ncbi:ArsR/SmtB family transcription factor [Actinophytocola xanthii]|uniref:ArsR family transcriptional regulator n=1 Tax=Actinophytocola xanthii TaxID=1912961 RepID=A0A1Q8CKN0_9PSEU|nr:metalloregulator ArsR/SmtB family transcription factor [Actinophytocola xanthii]OLF14903.1 ArsR family transcriptional regulator [Actinophytocola xanthii]
MDEVFRALADPSRRQLLDKLNDRNGQSLRELCAGLEMARQSVSKHLAVLVEANLVTTAWQGREKLHYLNAEPINGIARRWIHRYDRDRVDALADLKAALEEPVETTFVYTTYIRTTPERLWRALTEPEFTRRYWGGLELVSDWRVGSPVLLRAEPDGPAQDHDQVVLEADPHRRLAYSWHNYQPEHAELFGWSAERLDELRREPRTRVGFDLADLGDGRVRLTVTHAGFAGETEMYKAVSGRLEHTGGWPELLADLKTLLESALVG